MSLARQQIGPSASPILPPSKGILVLRHAHPDTLIGGSGLRSRGEARGPEGIEDFRLALDLVVGCPYDQQRSKGYGWLVDTPDDHYLTAAIVDVAHVFATHCLAESRPREAMWAAEKAIAAAPSEDRPRLDLVRATHAIGRVEQAAALLDQSVFGRTEDDRAPAEMSCRTDEVANRIAGRPHRS